MRKFFSLLIFPLVLIAVLCFTGYGMTDQYGTEEGFAVPPPLPEQEPPDVVVVPSSKFQNQPVYMAPDAAGVYVNQDTWYRQYEGNWFTAPAYNGVWMPIGIAFVPPIILSIPPEYPLYLPRGYPRIHYADYSRQWRSWETGRHLNNQRLYQNEKNPQVRAARIKNIERNRGATDRSVDRRNGRVQTKQQDRVRPDMRSRNDTGTASNRQQVDARRGRNVDPRNFDRQRNNSNPNEQQIRKRPQAPMQNVHPAPRPHEQNPNQPNNDNRRHGDNR